MATTTELESRLFLDPEGNPTEDTPQPDISVTNVDESFADQGFVPTNNLNADTLADVPNEDFQSFEEPAPPAIDGISTEIAELETTATTLGTEGERGQAFSEELERVNIELLGQTAFEAEQEEEVGLQGLIDTQKSISDRIKLLQAERKNIPDVIQQESIGRGRTAGGVAPLEMAELRRNSLQANILGAQLDAAKGDVASARDKIERALKIEFGHIEERQAVIKANLELILASPAYSLEEKNRANAQLELQKIKAAEVEQQKADKKSIYDLAVKAAKNGADALTIDNISKAENPAEALRIASEAGVLTTADEDKAFTLGKGQTRYDSSGNIIATNIDPDTVTDESIANLTPVQRSQAALLAKQLYGTIRTKDQIEQFLNPILERVAAGESIDNIADSLRFAGQSPEFTGIIRDASNQITADWTDKKSQTSFDKLDDLISKGDILGVQDFLKKLARDDAGVEQDKQITGQERTIEFLEEIASDLKAFEDGGGDTNIFTGTLEEIARRAGLVREPELRKLAVKITKARQLYRRSMTGVAFSEGENLEYDQVFPGINKTAEFNTAVLDGLKESFKGDVDFFYEHKMGTDAYEKIFKQGMLSDEFTSLRQWYDTNPENLQLIQGIVEAENMDEGEALQLINRIKQRSGFSNVGSDTNEATLSKVADDKVGEKKGQCGRYVNNITGLGVGDSFASKMAKMDKSIISPAPGMVFTMPYKNTGHCGIILSINNGMATVKDSNWSLDEKIKIHQIPVYKMAGFAIA